jgi:hypothetical protein
VGVDPSASLGLLAPRQGAEAEAGVGAELGLGLNVTGAGAGAEISPNTCIVRVRPDTSYDTSMGITTGTNQYRR